MRESKEGWLHMHGWEKPPTTDNAEEFLRNFQEIHPLTCSSVSLPLSESIENACEGLSASFSACSLTRHPFLSQPELPFEFFKRLAKPDG